MAQQSQQQEDDLYLIPTADGTIPAKPLIPTSFAAQLDDIVFDAPPAFTAIVDPPEALPSGPPAAKRRRDKKGSEAAAGAAVPASTSVPIEPAAEGGTTNNEAVLNFGGL